MLKFLYIVALLTSLVYFAFQWNKSSNKVKPALGLFFSFIPLINLALAAVVWVELYKKHGAKVATTLKEWGLVK